MYIIFEMKDQRTLGPIQIIGRYQEFGIGYIELAFLEYYDSQKKLLWVEAQLTDASYLFDKNCRAEKILASTKICRGERTNEIAFNQGCC